MREKKPLLSEDKKQRIRAAIAEVETKTTGEIAVRVSRQSSFYSGARWRIAIAFAFLTSLLMYGVHLKWGSVWNPIGYLLVQIPALWVGWLMSRSPWVLRFSLTPFESAAKVHEQALKTFYTQGLSQTRERSGILVLVSILEHQVEILADEGISAKVDPKHWIEVKDHLVAQIRDGHLTTGICNAIHECGEVLVTHFPQKGQPVNELPDHVWVD